MKKGAVIFGYDKPNRYSWSILMGFLEQDPMLMEAYDFYPLSFHLYAAPSHLEEIKAIPFQKYDFIVTAYSVLSIQIPQLTEFFTNFPKYYNQYSPNVVSVIGGPHITADPESLKNIQIDFFAQGEGELAFGRLLHAFLTESVDSIDCTKIPGIGRLNPHFIPAMPPDLVKLGQYPPFSAKFRLFGPIEISRGCPFRCKFCQTGNSSAKMRHASIDQIVKWVKLAVKIKFDKVWFLTPNAFAYGAKNGVGTNPEAIRELLSRVHTISGLKAIYFGTFPGEVRPESVTEEVLDATLPYIANKKLLIGAQTASNSLLKMINRGHSIEDVRKAITLLSKKGINTEIDFIFGLPGESEEDILANITFFEDILAGNLQKVKVHTHTFMPLPGTPFAEEAPGVLDPRIQKIVGQMAKRGLAYGEHLAQAGLVKTRYSK